MFLCEEFTNKVDSIGTRAYVQIVMDALRNPHTERPRDESKLGEVARQYALHHLHSIAYPIDKISWQVLATGHSGCEYVVLESFRSHILRVFGCDD
jgi:hypothetical protein